MAVASSARQKFLRKRTASPHRSEREKSATNGREHPQQIGLEVRRHILLDYLISAGGAASPIAAALFRFTVNTKCHGLLNWKLAGNGTPENLVDVTSTARNKPSPRRRVSKKGLGFEVAGHSASAVVDGKNDVSRHTCKPLILSGFNPLALADLEMRALRTCRLGSTDVWKPQETERPPYRG